MRRGTIIASGDPTRINKFHEGALKVIQSGKPLVISENDKKEWRGSRSGINLPIEFQGKIVGVIGISGEKKDVEEFGGLVKMTTEIMMKQAYIASQTEWQQRTKQIIIEELVKPEPNNFFVDQNLELLKIRLSPPFHIAIVTIQERNLQNQQLIQYIEEMHGGGKTLVGFLNENKMFILFCGISTTKVQKQLQLVGEKLTLWNIRNSMSMGTQIKERERLYLSFHEAELALLIGKVDHSITFYSDIESKALIYQMDKELRQRFLARILPDTTNKTIQTLDAYFAHNLSITDTAKELLIHRNTLIYRLKQVKETTGYDPQVFKDALTLQIAVWIHQKIAVE
jgi:carbohydrate diacid regulator